MALNNVSDLLQGIKRLFVGMQGVKSDLTMETIKTNDAGALKVSAELTGSIPLPIINTLKIIDADTTISSGGNYLSDLQTVVTGSSISVVVRFSATVKFRVKIVWYEADGAISSAEQTIIDNSAEAVNYNAVRLDLLSSKFRIKIYNDHGADISLRDLQLNIFGSTSNNSIKMQPTPTQRIPKYTISTIINAVSVAASTNTGDISLGLDGTETEVYLFINIDKQPWTLYTSIISGMTAANPATYPVYINSSQTFVTSNNPAVAFLCGVIFGATLSGIAIPTTMQEAKAISLPYAPTMTTRVLNSHATDAATVTVKAIRIWR